MKKQTKIILIVIVLAVVAYTIVRSLPEKSGEDANTQPDPVAVSDEAEKDWAILGEPTFAWTYAPFETDFIPYNVVSLTATYPDGTTRTKEIETIEGGCNEYVNPDEDVYPKSVEIICYYAGFGRYFKVVEEGGEYLVQRKEFEEPTPDYDPPAQDFVTLERF